ncbi:MAG: hypothetical protein P9X24_06695 [Candidatus Hatepunaea meridiana]|nr:hypothetical protein [Candidatus Hatepunaea meridiana]
MRAVIIGSSCSGKTTLAKAIGKRTGIKHLELDAVSWLPNWESRDTNDLRRLVEIEVQKENWIIDGNYTILNDIIWSKATTILWLNLPFYLIFYRAITRTIGRIFTKEELFSGCYETFCQSFFTKDSIIWWVITTWRKKRNQYRQIFDNPTNMNIDYIEIRSPGETEQLIENIYKKYIKENSINQLQEKP